MRHPVREDFVSTQQLTKRAKAILDAKYDPINVSEVVAAQSQLKAEEKEQLAELLSRRKNIFNGELGDWKGTDIKLEVQENAKPFHSRAYPVPQTHERTMRIEVQCMIALGVLEE